MQKKWEKFKGENHWNYDTNKTDEERIIDREYPEYHEWRKQVFERDDYICQVCGLSGYLHAHHLNGYHWAIDQRTDSSNGITLCDGCHNNFHEIFGSECNTREQFEEYIEGISWSIKELYRDLSVI